MLSRSLASQAVVGPLQRAVLGEPFSSKTVGCCGHGYVREVCTGRTTAERPEAFRVHESLFSSFKNLQIYFCTLEIRLHVRYFLHLPTEAFNLMEEHQVKKGNVSKSGSGRRRPNLKLQTEKSTDSVGYTSETDFWNKIIMFHRYPLSTAPRPRSMKLLSQFRLPERKHSECQDDKSIKVFQDFLFPVFLIAATVTCCTDSVTGMLSHHRHQNKNCRCTVYTPELITLRHVRIGSLQFSKELKFNVLPENWNLVLSLYCRAHSVN